MPAFQAENAGSIPVSHSVIILRKGKPMSVRNRTRTLLASAARTATFNTEDRSNQGYSAIRVRINVSAATATPSVVFRIQGKNPDGTYTELLASAAVTGTGDTVLTVGRGLPVTANVSANVLVPANWRLRAEHADADSITYSATVEQFV